MLSPQSPTAGVSSPVSLATPDPLARPARDPLAAPAAEQPRVDAASELPTPTSAEEDLRRDAELYTPRDEPASPSSRSSVVRFTVGGKTLGAERVRSVETFGDATEDKRARARGRLSQDQLPSPTASESISNAESSHRASRSRTLSREDRVQKLLPWNPKTSCRTFAVLPTRWGPGGVGRSACRAPAP